MLRVPGVEAPAKPYRMEVRIMALSKTSYRRIPLTQKQFTIVSVANYHNLMCWDWYAVYNRRAHCFYAVRTVSLPDGRKSTIHMQRQILGLVHGDRLAAQHINRNSLDNRRDNLRIIARGDQLRKTQSYKGAESKGVAIHLRRNRCCAYIVIKGKAKHLGFYDLSVEGLQKAREVYQFAEDLYLGAQMK